jgi:hypothetical protein
LKELRNAACELADRGWHIIPIRPKAKAPLTRLVPKGKDNASNDLAQVLRWWQKAPRANVGIVANPSGLVVLDVDERNGGFETLAALEGEWGRLPHTVSAVSGGGGAHYYFTHPGGVLRGTIGEGIDIKDHGYVLAPPSVHDSGRRYEWDEHPDEVEVAALEGPWLGLLKYGASREMVARSPGQHTDPLRQIPAAVYVARLTGRELQRGDVFTCPWHSGGEEWEPSLKVDGEVWACHGCPPILGKRAFGGNIYDFAGLLAGYPVPLRGADYLDIKERLRKVFA